MNVYVLVKHDAYNTPAFEIDDQDIPWGQVLGVYAKSKDVNNERKRLDAETHEEWIWYQVKKFELM